MVSVFTNDYGMHGTFDILITAVDQYSLATNKDLTFTLTFQCATSISLAVPVVSVEYAINTLAVYDMKL